ncbi:E3 ubiquitin-protein ligase CCNB1IP1 [Colletotrichum tofieldiae]|nr:E3 ubiquitin-protein ligase CCNB1IP1 [Colletotrichum tofieldiae]GKT69798.1 E3 ubiquitin-protein ligase CCNB1IP1 [Colletotrichum tofieldiae]GKT92811.1 E3 ubiquitin-protein ligase CCNB1IP1 [Colletotrichum tofieldiae]
MDHTLKCNVLKCRKELVDQALVTTCSSQLTKPDDAVVANLNLTEDYKTSVLSGLSPNVIMECAGRALSFWAYQTTQEIVYQRYLEKTLTAKLKSLDMKFQKTVDDANAEIASLQEKLQGKFVSKNAHSGLDHTC